MAKYDDENNICCSFCGRPHSQVKRLVAGPDVYICDECIRMCADILREELPQSDAPSAAKTEAAAPGKLLKPREIKDTLSDYVIDQDKAKKILAANCGRSAEQVAADTERDHWMTAKDALDYGIIDHIIENHPRSN